MRAYMHYIILVKSRMHTLHFKLSQPDIADTIKMNLTKRFMDQLDSYRELEDQYCKYMIDLIYDSLYAVDLYVCMDMIPNAVYALKEAIVQLDLRIRGPLIMKKRLELSSHDKDILGDIHKLDGVSKSLIASYL